MERPGVGVLVTQFPLFHYYPNFSALSKHISIIEYHVYNWQVPLQLSCSDTCQIRIWFKEYDRYCCMIKYFVYRKINKQSFSNPHPWFSIGLDLLPYSMFMAQIASTLGLTSIKHQSDAKVSYRCRFDVDPRVFAIWESIHWRMHWRLWFLSTNPSVSLETVI